MPEKDNNIPIKRKRKVNRTGIFIGVLIILFALTWFAAGMGWIPSIVFDIWPQIIILIIGIFILYKSL